MTGRQGRVGAVLLELVLALGLFIIAGLSVTAAVGLAQDSYLRSRDELRAADLARSAMARLECGLASATTLTGPVAAWSDAADWLEGDALVGPEGADRIAFDESLPPPTEWELEVLTEPSEFEGLTLVSVTARRVVEDEIIIEHTLHQLARLGEEDADIAGEQIDALGRLGGRP
ncbi:MAG: hypothetical protein H6811_00260 [Phycisphaeraceae bacterium]|nr:hypothetical protein [Phycisphaeraceae bacterium]